MRGMNKAMLIGHLGRDPELRTGGTSGVSWCTFTLATSRNRREGDGWTETTDWHRVKVFGAQAEATHLHMRKGSLVAVEGSVTYEQWTDQEGNRRVSTVILADRVNFLNRGERARDAEVAEAK